MREAPCLLIGEGTGENRLVPGRNAKKTGPMQAQNT
jgi:hypothetical protein